MTCTPHAIRIVLRISDALGRRHPNLVEQPGERGSRSGRAAPGLETIFISRVRRRGVSVRQQIVIAGHAVDALIGERLVVQIDGYMFHSSAADRGRDVAHDAELVARGYTVLRFTYAQLIHDWPSVDRSIGRALAAGLHRAA